MALLTRAKMLLEKLGTVYRVKNRGGWIRWGIGAYGVATLACTAAWLVIGPQAVERTGLRRELFLANDFAGRPFRDEVSENVFVYRGDSTSADVGAEFFLNSHAEAY